MCLGCPKRPRSSRNSKVDRRSARTKAVQNVRRPSAHRAPWHVVACALTRACNDASSSAHPNRLASPHCTQAQIPHRCNPQHTHAQDPTTSQHAQMCTSNDKATWQHKVERTAAATSPGDMRARSAQIRPLWAVRGSPRAALRLDRYPLLRRWRDMVPIICQRRGGGLCGGLVRKCRRL